MPNWKKVLTSGSNIQISELTLQAAGVHKASIDTSGNIAAEGNISSSGVLSGTSLTLTSAGVHKARIDTSGNVSAEGTISGSGQFTATNLQIETNGSVRSTIDTSGNLFAASLSSSGVLNANTVQLANNGVNTLNISNAGAISASSTIQGTAFTAQTNGVTKATIDASGNISSSGGTITTSTLKGHGTDTIFACLGKISASEALLGQELTLAKDGTTKTEISSDGSASFAGGISTFYDATASLGYITASQLIIQGTDQNAGIALQDNDGNSIAQFARCGSGTNAHKGRMLIKDNATTKIEFTSIGTSYVMGAFSSSAAIEANSFEQTSNGTTLAQITNQGVINAKMGLITHTIGANTGDVVYFGGTTSMTTGDIYHYKSDGTWELADCNAAATSDGLLAVALGAASDTNGMLLRGMATLAEIDGTEEVGMPLYLSEDNTGHANVAAPAGNGDIVRVIGYCLHASNKTIWFNPDNTFVEVTA